MKSSFRSLLATLIAVVAVSYASAQSNVVSGSFDANRTSYAIADQSTKSVVTQTYADVPDMVLFFDVALGQAVKVDFSVSMAATPGNPISIRMVFDENPNLLIAPATITVDPKTNLTHYSTTFVLPLENGLGPGNHNVRIQWRSSNATYVVSRNRTLVIQHN